MRTFSYSSSPPTLTNFPAHPYCARLKYLNFVAAAATVRQLCHWFAWDDLPLCSLPISTPHPSAPPNWANIYAHCAIFHTSRTELINLLGTGATCAKWMSDRSKQSLDWQTDINISRIHIHRARGRGNAVRNPLSVKTPARRVVAKSIFSSKWKMTCSGGGGGDGVSKQLYQMDSNKTAFWGWL